MTDTELEAALAPRLTTAEGDRCAVYLDINGYATAGHGHKLTADERALYPVGSVISSELDADWFAADVAYAIVGARRDAPEFDSLPDIVQQVLVEIAYNQGAAGLAGYHHMLTSMAAGDWLMASDQLMDSRGARQLPKRYGELRDRILSCVEVSDGRTKTA